MCDQYWQTVGQWEQYFAEHELIQEINKKANNERIQETNAGKAATTEQETRENRS
jgi:hypothetical protein